jgi:hypothetical protein
MRRSNTLARIHNTYAESQVKGVVTQDNGGKLPLVQNKWSQFYTSMVKTD